MIALWALLLAAPAIDPAAAAIYGADDPQIQLKQKIESLMGIYLVDPPRRHRSERVHLRRGQVRIDIWHPVAGLSDIQIKTRAVDWFVFGRTQYAPGVGGVFGEFPKVSEALIVFHDVVRPKQKGRRKSKQADQVKKFLAIKLTRKRFERLNLKAVEKCVFQGDCSREFATGFTKTSFDAKYTARQRSEDQ